jgi:hypothetical protein
VLENLASAVHVKDLNIPSNVKVLDNMEDVVVTVSAPRKEEEETAAPSTGIEGTAAEAAAKEEAVAAETAAAAPEGAAKEKTKE